MQAPFSFSPIYEIKAELHFALTQFCMGKSKWRLALQRIVDFNRVKIAISGKPVEHAGTITQLRSRGTETFEHRKPKVI